MEECLPNCDGFSILENCGIKNYHSSTEDMLVLTKIIQSWKLCDLCCAVGQTRLSQWHSGIIYGCICEALLAEESTAHFVEEFLLMTGFVLAFFPQCAQKPNSNYQFLGQKHKNVCLHFLMQISRCNPEEWVREAESCGQGLSQSVGCDIVWWMALGAHRAGSLGSSIWESQPQTTAAHTSCLKDERILFAAVSAFQGKCLFSR